MSKGGQYDLSELTARTINFLIREMKAAKEKRVAAEYKNWIKKVKNYLDSHLGKAGIRLSYFVCP